MSMFEPKQDNKYEVEIPKPPKGSFLTLAIGAIYTFIVWVVDKIQKTVKTIIGD